MNRRAFFLSAVASCGALGAQEIKPGRRPVPAEAAGGEAAFFEFKHLNPQMAASVAELASELFSVYVRYDSSLNSVVIRPKLRAAADWQAKTIEFLRKYDVPSPNEAQVHYTAYLIRASNRPPRPTEKPNSVPPDLDEALAEMKKALSYAHYDLLTTVSTISQGDAESSDALPINDISRAFDIVYSGVSVAPDRKSVSIHPFRFRLRVSTTKPDILASIESNITIREGQKLVLGKVHLSDETDLFVVLTAKVE